MSDYSREPRPDKVAVVDEVRTRFVESDAAILTEYRGLSVKQIEELRRALRGAGGEYKVYKNTLVRRAATESGRESLLAFLEGPTAIAFAKADIAGVAKVLRDFSRQNASLVVKGGYVGDSLLDQRDASALADLPSREVLLTQIAGMIAAPMRQFASLLQAIPQRFAYALAALVDERQGSQPVVPQGHVEETPARATETATTETATTEPATAEGSSEESSADDSSKVESSEREFDAETETDSTDSGAVELQSDPTSDAVDSGPDEAGIEDSPEEAEQSQQGDARADESDS